MDFRVGGLSCVVALWLLSGSASGEEVATEAPANDTKLETIMVTANKRTEDIKDVPTSISVLGGTELGDHHITDYDDITRSIPGVSFGAGGGGQGVGEGLANIEIRGISSTTGSATVGIYLDEVPITVRNTYDGATQPILFDMNSVEVLRGPQGTLYGASSMGGTIRFLSNQADIDKTSVDAASDLSGTEHGSVNYDEQAVVNVPVVPGMLAIRAGVDYGDDSGWIDRYGLDGQLLAGGINDQRHLVLKLDTKLQLDNGLTITPDLYFQRVYSSDAPSFYPALGLYEQNKEVVESGKDAVFVPSVTVNDPLGFADLTSVSSYFWREMFRTTDGTYYNSTVFADYFIDAAYPNTPAQAINTLATLPSPVDFHTTYGQVEQEIRLASPASDRGPIRWVAGLYYNDQWENHHDFEPIPGLEKTFESIYGVSLDNSLLGVPGDPGLYQNDLIYWDWAHEDERQYAGFGQLDFDVLPNLHGAVGMRYLYARVSYTRYGGGFYDLGNVHPYSQDSKYYAATPKFSTTYDLSDTANIYATVAKGFRLGGPTGPTPVGPGNPCSQDYANLDITSPPLKFDSDKLWSYELGSKSRLLDNTLSVDAAVYYIDWMNVQQTIDLPICGFNFTQNIGDAESYGTELEVRYKPPSVRGLTLGVTAGADHAVITSTTNAATAAVGEKILYTPDWTATLLVDYDWTVGTLDAFVRADYDWVGRSHGSFQHDNPNYSDPQYGVVNASVGVDTGTWQVSLYAKNLFDNSTAIQRPQVDTVIEGYTVRPLTVGVHVETHF